MRQLAANDIFNVNANIDLPKTCTSKFVKQANAKTGMALK